MNEIVSKSPAQVKNFSCSFLENAEWFCDGVHDFRHTIDLLVGLKIYFRLTVVGSTRSVCEWLQLALQLKLYLTNFIPIF